MAAPAGLGVCGERSKFYEELVEELCVFAEHGFHLDRKRADGSSERDNLESAQSQIKNLPGWKGKKVIVPDAPPFPLALNYLWRYFIEHSMGVSQNGMGPALVTWEGLRAWCELMRITLEPWESLALVRLGQCRARVDSEKKPEPKSNPEPPSSSKRRRKG